MICRIKRIVKNSGAKHTSTSRPHLHWNPHAEFVVSVVLIFLVNISENWRARVRDDDDVMRADHVDDHVIIRFLRVFGLPTWKNELDVANI